MYTLTIMDRDNASGLASVTLLDLLREVKGALGQLEWVVYSLEVLGIGADKIYEIERRRARISTAELEHLAATLDQVIDGDFVAYKGDSVEPIVRIRAVDSTSWDVSTDEHDILERVRRSFKHIYEAGDVGDNRNQVK